MPELIEIASYPKCGNTWIRHLIAGVFHTKVLPPDFHVSGGDTKSKMRSIQLRDNYYFYKSHLFNNSKMKPDKIIFIYRHPLDVFLSCLNFKYLHDRKECFFGKKVKSVREIIETGEMERYFRRFMDDLGKSFYGSMLGPCGNYGVYLEEALFNEKSFSVKYEDLIDNGPAVFSNLLKRVIPNETIEVADSLFNEVDRATKHSGRSFFWSASKENYKKFLTERQIARFKERHRLLLRKAGYS